MHVAVSSKSEVRECWTLGWQMMSVEMARAVVRRTKIHEYELLRFQILWLRDNTNGDGQMFGLFTYLL